MKIYLTFNNININIVSAKLIISSVNSLMKIDVQSTMLGFMGNGTMAEVPAPQKN